MKKLVLVALLILPLNLLAETEQPPRAIKDPAISESFVLQGYCMDQHRHSGTDCSSKLRTTTPDADSTYDLGASGTEWANLYVDSITVTNLGSFLGYKVGTFTSDSGGGQSVASVGFKPRLVVFWHQRGSDSGTGFAFGAMDKDGNQIASGGNLEQGGDMSGSGIQTNRCIHLVTTDAATYISAHFTSMDTDGFSIEWDTASAGLTIGYIAFR